MLKTDKSILPNKNISVGLILISFVILFGMVSYYVPYAFDDIAFYKLYTDYSDGENVFSFKTLYNYALEIRADDNGRLSNILCGPAIAFIPKWMFAIFTGVGFALMYWLMNFIIGISRSRLATFILLSCACSFFLLPMRDHIFVCDYILNYIWPSIFIFWFIWLLSHAQKGNLSVPGIIGSIFVAIFAAWFHEGFSVPVCIGLAFLCIVKKFKFSWQWWILVVVFGIVSIWVTCAPGVLMRANTEFNGLSIAGKIKIAVTQFPAVILLLIFLIISIKNKSFASIRTKLLNNPITFVTTVSAFAGLIIVLCINSAPRASWPGEIFSLVSLLYVLSKTELLSLRYFRFIPLLCYVFICFLLTTTIIWQKRFFDENNEIFKQLSESEEGTIYYDIIDPTQARWPTLGMAVNDLWSNDWHYGCLSELLDKPCAVVPTALKDFSIEKAQRIDGPDSLMVYKGLLIGPERNYKRCKDVYLGDISDYQFTTDSNKDTVIIPCLSTRFVMPDGRKYTYIAPFYDIEGEITFGQRIN